MVDTPPCPITLGENDLPTAGEGSTCSTAVFDGAPVPPPPVTPLVVLRLPPATDDVTEKVMVQEPDAGTVPALTVMAAAPAAAAGEVVTPAQVPPTTGEVNTMPAGKVSEKLTGEIAVAVGLLRVSVTVAVPPALMVAGAKDLLMPIRPAVSTALVALPAPPLVEVTRTPAEPTPAAVSMVLV